MEFACKKLLDICAYILSYPNIWTSDTKDADRTPAPWHTTADPEDRFHEPLHALFRNILSKEPILVDLKRPRTSAISSPSHRSFEAGIELCHREL